MDTIKNVKVYGLEESIKAKYKGYAFKKFKESRGNIS